MILALAGNPNSGKTTMYNTLTGRNEKIGNWAGVTVEKNANLVKKKYNKSNERIIAIDLPGAYSMSPFSSEESITSTYVKNENPDVIINIVDATNLGRSLFFTTQLLELGIPVVIALNKSDSNDKKGNDIDIDKLSKALNAPVLKTTAIHDEGLEAVIEKCIEVFGKGQVAPYKEENVDLKDEKQVEIADRKRFEFVKSLVKDFEHKKDHSFKKNIGDEIDDYLTHPLIGLLLFAFVMFIVFYISQAEGFLGIGKYLEGIFTGVIELFQAWVGKSLEGINPVLYAILVEGIIGGVGAVVGFLPLVMVMYFLIALLEDCGYMSRATVVLDPLFKKVGLSGKSVIPMVIGTGCSIPAVMASRTIRSERERRTTAMLSTFMPCGAKLPVIALFAGAFFPGSSFVAPLMYFMGIAIILICALLVNAITGAKYKKSYFIIELPEYKLPSIKFAIGSMIERGKSYVIKAGTVILICNTVVQIMKSFDFHLNVVKEGMYHTSILGTIAVPVSYLLYPIVGVVAWQLSAAALTGLIAKENIVGTIATVYAITSFIDVDTLQIVGRDSAIAQALGITPVAALAYLSFNLFSPPCFAALSALNAELKSRKWMMAAVFLQLATGFSVGYLIYQIGTLLTTGSFGNGFIHGLVAEAIIIGIVVFMIIKSKRELRG